MQNSCTIQATVQDTMLDPLVSQLKGHLRYAEQVDLRL